MSEPCTIIGLLEEGPASLTPRALARLREANLVIGAGRMLARCADQCAEGTECRELEGALAAIPGWIEEARRAGRRVVVLASGDPLCHGIAGYLIGKLGRESFEILPHLTSLQLASARLGLPWQSMTIASVHAREADEWVHGAGPEHGFYALLQALRQTALMGVLTAPGNGPERIARLLLTEGLGDDFELAVAERLASPDERIHDWSAVETVARGDYQDPNVLLIRRLREEPLPMFGLADDTYHQRVPDKGLITRREVRAVSLARLALRPDSRVWDIGAGSGSVGLEAARLCFRGHVYAIEKNSADKVIAESNRARLRVTNYTLIQGRAPEGLDRWPDPDAVFIGGSGGELAELIRISLERLRESGWLVMNFVTLENLSSALELLKKEQAEWEVTQMQCARSRPILDMNRLQAENPVWIVSARRPPIGDPMAQP